MMNKKKWIATGIFAAILLMQVLLLPITAAPLLSGGLMGGAGEEVAVFRQGGEEGIAFLRLEGMILDLGGVAGPFAAPGYQHQRFLGQLERAFASPEYKGVVLYVDSPGGGIYESDEIYQAIAGLKEKYEKPYVVYMSRLAASGGYYVSAPADWIVANRNTITGSIGVVISGLNVAELLERYGIKDQTISSGPNKTILSPYQEMRPDQRAIIQSVVDESYGYFVDVVADGRKMEREQVLALADGRIYTGPQALEAGLVDQLGSLETAFDAVAERAGVANPTIYVFRNPQWSFPGNLFGAVPGVDRLFGAREDAALLGLAREIAGQGATGPRPMYLWEW